MLKSRAGLTSWLAAGIDSRPAVDRAHRRAWDASRVQGISMLEVVVAMAIMAVSIAAALPSVTGYFQNAKLRSTAQSFFSGAEAARTEAVKRNGGAQFVLSATGVTNANANSVTTSVTGQNWAVLALPLFPATDPILVEARPVQEGASTSVGVSSDVGSVSFNGLGQASTTMTINFTNSAGGACAPAGPMRCLRLVVSAGGQVRLCDPQATVLNDSRGC